MNLRFIAAFSSVAASLWLQPLSVRAETPPLLAHAIEKWIAGHEDLAFTQHTRVLRDNGEVKEERVERYDPSLPDNQRWRLIEWNGQPASWEQRQKWEGKKNNRPRKKTIKPPGEYLDLEHAALVERSDSTTRFEVNFRPEAARLVAVEKIAVRITVDNRSETITHISGLLKEPLRIALGLARITDIDLDLHIVQGAGPDWTRAGDVQTGSTARVRMSKFGDPMEFRWSDFKRVKTYRNEDARAQLPASRPPARS